MKVRIVKDYFASDEVYKIARKNGHTWLKDTVQSNLLLPSSRKTTSFFKKNELEKVAWR